MNRKLKVVVLTTILLAGGYVGVGVLVSSVYDNAVLEMKQGRFEAAKRKIEWLAMFGHPQAQASLGEMYAYGRGVPRNREEAIRWFRRTGGRPLLLLKEPAAPSAYFVGERYAKGESVKKDIKEAEWWLQFAREGGYSCDSGEHFLSAFPVLIAGGVAFRDYENYLRELETINNRNSEYRSDIKNYKINLEIKEEYFLVEFNSDKKINNFMYSAEAKYKIDKNNYHILGRELKNN